MTPNAPPLADLDAPQELKALKQWVVWRFVDNPEEGKKPLKMPYYAKTGNRRGAQNTQLDRHQLVTFAEAKAAAIAGGYEGIGLAFIKGTPITGLDFDNCIKDNCIDAGVLKATQGTYTERSPSGNGIRAFVLGELGNRKNCLKAESGIGFELFNSSGFLTYTGNITLETEVDGPGIAPPNPSLLAMIADRFNPDNRLVADYERHNVEPLGLTEQEIVHALSFINCNCSYDEWRGVGMALHHETQGQGLHLWDDWSSEGITYPGPEAIKGKWESFGKYGGTPLTMGSVLGMARDGGHNSATVDDFDILGDEPGAPKNRMFVPAEEFMLEEVSLSWLVKHFLPHADFGMLYGASGSGKSFLALDMAMAIVRGIDWNGHRVTRGRVLYVVAEGRTGFTKRLAAYKRQHAASLEGLDVMPRQIPNLVDVDSVSQMVNAALKAGNPYCLIILDTFAQMTSGADENNGKDMGTALEQCQRISQSTGAMLLVVHHSGKDAAKGARGWSGLKAAADVEFEVNRHEDQRSITVSKMKDGQGEGTEHAFKLHTIILAQDEDGDDITSCIVEYVEGGRVYDVPKVVLNANQQTAWSVFIDLSGVGNAQVLRKDYLDALIKEIPGGRDDNILRAAKAAIRGLCMKGYLKEEGDVLINAQNSASCEGEE